MKKKLVENEWNKSCNISKLNDSQITKCQLGEKHKNVSLQQLKCIISSCQNQMFFSVLWFCLLFKENIVALGQAEHDKVTTIGNCNPRDYYCQKHNNLTSHQLFCWITLHTKAFPVENNVFIWELLPHKEDLKYWKMLSGQGKTLLKLNKQENGLEQSWSLWTDKNNDKKRMDLST